MITSQRYHGDLTDVVKTSYSFFEVYAMVSAIVADLYSR